MNLMRNPCSNLKKLSSMIDPKMLAQIGGPDNLMSVMKEISNNPEMMKMRMGELEGKNNKKKI